jgi:predicted RNA methylase
MNKKSMKFFEQLSKENNQNSVKLANNSDFSALDADFILNYVSKNSAVLDLGTGTGLIVNKICNKIERIVAVEYFSEFSKFIKKNKNIEIVNTNIFDYETKEKFDCITIFAVMHYLNEQEAVTLYKKYFDLIKNEGKLIIKNQFGIREDVEVSGYSEEQKDNYYAQYRHIDKEVNILSEIGYKNIEVVDIYPPECNRWENTHFYAIVASI